MTKLLAPAATPSRTAPRMRSVASWTRTTSGASGRSASEGEAVSEPISGGGGGADLGVLRVDREEPALEAQRAAVLESDPTHEGARTGADDGDGAGTQDRRA